MGTEIVTYTGKVFDFLNPKPEMVCIEDIAHSLSNLCRYTGHVRKFYSVGEHCILMALSDKCPGDPMSKLLHDAAEAYIGDMASPWKRLLQVEPTFEKTLATGVFGGSVREFENRILEIISEALGVSINITAEVKTSDMIMLATEVRDLMPSSEAWGELPEPLEIKIPCWKSAYVEEHFLNIYSQLKARGV